MKLSELPENYRKAQGIDDFSVGDIVYELGWDSYFSGTVEYVGYHVSIKWDDSLHSEGYNQGEVFFIYVKEKEQNCNFKVNDRVLLVEKGEFKPRVKITGTILDVRNQYIAVKWDDIADEDAISYSKDQWKHIKVINKAPKLTKEITLDLKVHFNLDTTGIETVLVDCVKALVYNGKYQEAKELCELLVSVQSLGKAKDEPQEKTEDDSTEGA